MLTPDLIRTFFCKFWFRKRCPLKSERREGMGEHAGREKPTEQESILRPVTGAKLRPGGEEASRNRDGRRNGGVFCPAREVLEEGPRSRHTLQYCWGCHLLRSREASGHVAL